MTRGLSLVEFRPEPMEVLIDSQAVNFGSVMPADRQGQATIERGLADKKGSGRQDERFALQILITRRRRNHGYACANRADKADLGRVQRRSADLTPVKQKMNQIPTGIRENQRGALFCKFCGRGDDAPRGRDLCLKIEKQALFVFVVVVDSRLPFRPESCKGKAEPPA